MLYNHRDKPLELVIASIIYKTRGINSNKLSTDIKTTSIYDKGAGKASLRLLHLQEIEG